MNNEQKERRERIATAVLAGICANPTPFQTDRQLIQEALGISDALIRALDYERGTGVDCVQNGGDNGEA